VPKPAVIHTPTILTVNVADDLARNAERVRSIELRLQLSGAAPGDSVEVKLNGVLLSAPPVLRDGWRVFAPAPRQFAPGRNLVSIRLGERAPQARGPVTVEKLEVQVAYS
jgi:hypothetical protein